MPSGAALAEIALRESAQRIHRPAVVAGISLHVRGRNIGQDELGWMPRPLGSWLWLVVGLGIFIDPISHRRPSIARAICNSVYADCPRPQRMPLALHRSRRLRTFALENYIRRVPVTVNTIDGHGSTEGSRV
jgi:hypothetical protein